MNINRNTLKKLSNFVLTYHDFNTLFKTIEFQCLLLIVNRLLSYIEMADFRILFTPKVS